MIGERYRLGERIGRGRLGQIYAASETAEGGFGEARQVAIQLLDADVVSNQRRVDELRRGFAALRSAPHPNVVEILEFSRDRSRFFLVMELLDGASLRFVLDDATTLPTTESAAMARAVGDALQYLHAKSLVHGALRAENVFITFDYGVKLLDIAPLGRLSSAPYYVEDMEQRGSPAPLDKRDDVFGLACLTYELLSGRHPFNANSPLEAYRAALKPQPIDALTVRQWQALTRALSLLRAQRTPTVAEFLEQFGVTGAERLRPDSDPAEVSAPAPVSNPDARDPRPVTYLAPRADTDHRDLRRRPRPAARRPLGRMLWTLLQLAVVAGLGGVVYFQHDRLRDGAAQLMADLDAGWRNAPSEPISVNVSPARAAGVEVALAPPASPSVVEGGVEPQLAPTETNPAQAIAAETAVIEAAAPIEAPRIEPAAPRLPAEPRFRFADSVVTVAEGQGAAQIVVERSDDTAAASLVWWTAADTAIAGEDYADFGQSTEDFAPGEQSRVLLVPLVSDSVPETRESFYVHLGRVDTRQGRLEPLATSRVEISDDD
jgi:hypothetical protein